jgi:hypothetical protein
MSEQAYTLVDMMMPQVYTRKFSLIVLNQLLSSLIQLKSEKVFPLLEEMMRVELKPHIKQYPLYFFSLTVIFLLFFFSFFLSLIFILFPFVHFINHAVELHTLMKLCQILTTK